MKIKKEKQEIILLEEPKQEYKFKLEEKEIFKLLTSKLYSNPLRTMIQEYISNARDIHRQVKQTKPIDIFFDEYNQLHIKDYGTGLSEEDLKNVFIYFGRSTKRTTNKQIGGFGIGAKSGFAYTDSFTIVNRYNGEKITYLATIKDDVPALIEINREKANDTGLEIIIPIDADEIDIAKSYIFDLTMFWYNGTFNKYDRVNIHFTCDDVTLDEFAAEDIEVNNLSYALLNHRSDESSMITIEGIPYFIDDESKYIYFKGFVPHFKIGELDVTNNREELKSGQIDKIEKKVKKILKQIIKNKDIKHILSIESNVTNDKIVRNKYFYYKNRLRTNLKYKHNGIICDIFLDADNKTLYNEPPLNYIRNIIVYNKSIREFNGYRKELQDRYASYGNSLYAMSKSEYKELIKTEPGIVDVIKFLFIDDILPKKETPTKKEKSARKKYIAYTISLYDDKFDKIEITDPDKEFTKTVNIEDRYEFPKYIYIKDYNELVKMYDDELKNIQRSYNIRTVKSKAIKEKYNLPTYNDFVNFVSSIKQDLIENYKEDIRKAFVIEKLRRKLYYSMVDIVDEYKVVDKAVKNLLFLIRRDYKVNFEDDNLTFDYRTEHLLEDVSYNPIVRKYQARIAEDLQNHIKETYGLNVKFSIIKKLTKENK